MKGPDIPSLSKADYRETRHKVARQLVGLDQLDPSQPRDERGWLGSESVKHCGAYDCRKCVCESCEFRSTLVYITRSIRVLLCSECNRRSQLKRYNVGRAPKRWGHLENPHLSSSHSSVLPPPVSLLGPRGLPGFSGGPLRRMAGVWSEGTLPRPRRLQPAGHGGGPPHLGPHDPRLQPPHPN